MLRFGLCSLLLLFAASTGCAHEDYAYRPAGPTFAGAPAARYPIPPEAPRGEVYVTSFGFADVDLPDRDADMLHVRLAVSNNGGDVFSVDGRQQMLVATGQPPVGPAFLNTDAGAGPVYAVPPGQHRVFDLYYAPPPPYADARALGGFELQWQVQAGGQIVAQRTPFERILGAYGTSAYGPYPPYLALRLGFGFGWWYGPYYGYRYPPFIRSYFYPPARGRAAAPSAGGSWRGSPSGGAPRGGWRGSPGGGTPRGGGWRGRAR